MPQCCYVGKNIITSSLKYVLNVRVESFYQNNKEVLKSINDEITHIVFAMGEFFKYDAWKTREITFSYMWDLLGENLLWLCLGQWLSSLKRQLKNKKKELIQKTLK